MPKTKEAKYKELKEKTNKPTIDSSIEALSTQLVEYRKQAEYFKTMAIKVEGALEVLNQLKEDDGDA